MFGFISKINSRKGQTARINPRRLNRYAIFHSEELSRQKEQAAVQLKSASDAFKAEKDKLQKALQEKLELQTRLETANLGHTAAAREAASQTAKVRDLETKLEAVREAAVTDQETIHLLTQEGEDLKQQLREGKIQFDQKKQFDLVYVRNLARYRGQFEATLNQFKVQIAQLLNKRAQNNNSNAEIAATRLIATLEDASQKFFESKRVNRRSYEYFKATSEKAIEEAAPIFREHRGWGKIWQYLNVLLGVMLMIPVGIPALLIGQGERYQRTFFAPSPTNSFKKLNAFREETRRLLEKIDEICEYENPSPAA